MSQTKKSRDGTMSIAQHLVELQKRIIICAIAIVAAAIGAWFIAPFVLDALREPLLMVMQKTGRQTQINYSDVSSPLNVRMHITMVLGIIIAAPIWLYELWRFLAPGMLRKEKLTAVGFVGTAIPLFLGGCLFGWWAFPNLVSFMSSFASADDVQLISADTYLRFVMNLMLFMGLGFVLPLLLVLLNFVGVMSAKTIIKGWRVAIVVALIFAAFITPPTDILSMFLLSSPMLGLYLIACLISWLHDRRAAKRAQTLLEDDALPDPDIPGTSDLTETSGASDAGSTTK
ncbi:twin-arginine translocase subunit TatC [Pseudoclavibacter sp. CFCC 11306]|uniref:twin-arginine translocase subunit TatC n=1 Tax=Pseudoclavibacter sp. CFCC 11306 TaxID=1564493 RepID=UPI001CE408DE|nr:twin-arginine translocase subunit TatC [Pseudoclavibacter sp. CFCC 11306]